MKPRILAVILFLSSWLADAQAQTTKEQKEIAEVKALQAEFVKATNEYKASLAKLLTIYEGNVTKAEEKLELSKKLLAEGLISTTQVEENERAIIAAKEKVAETHRQITKADSQITALPSDEELIKEYRRAQRSRPRASPKGRCRNWDLIVRQRQGARSISVSYTFVCR